MKKTPWLAHPWLSALLAVSWLLLQHTLAPFHLLSAVLIGLIVPRLLHPLLPPAPTIRLLPALRSSRSTRSRRSGCARGTCATARRAYPSAFRTTRRPSS